MLKLWTRYLKSPFARVGRPPLEPTPLDSKLQRWAPFYPCTVVGLGIGCRAPGKGRRPVALH
jgi:hypothetical protein